jgi:hypothetical protein
LTTDSEVLKQVLIKTPFRTPATTYLTEVLYDEVLAERLDQVQAALACQYRPVKHIQFGVIR